MLHLFSTKRFHIVLLFLLVLSGSRQAWAQNAPAWASVQRSSSLGAASASSGSKIAIGADGSQLVTGLFVGTITIGSVTLTAGPGSGHLFLAKYSASGTVLWATKLDAASSSNLFGNVAVDTGGNIFLGGSFTSSLTLNSTTLTSAGTDAYLVKYNAQGTQQWVVQGGTPGTFAQGLATDVNGNVTVVGDCSTAVAFGGTPLNGAGVFLYRFSPTGSILVSAQVGTGGVVTDMALDGTGNAYIVGYFSTSAVFGNTSLAGAGLGDIFLVKANAAGASIWARREGGVNADVGNCVAVDAGGNPIIAGYYDMPTRSSSAKLFLARYSSQGVSLWARQIIASNLSFFSADDVAYDGRGGCYVTGTLRGEAVFGATTLTAVGDNAFLARYDIQGNAVWAERAVSAGIPDGSNGRALAADAGGNIYIAGTASGAVTFGALPATTGGVDAFVARLGAGGVITAARNRETVLPLVAYPNPASTQLTIAAASGVSYRMIDALGRIVRKQQLPADEYQLSLSGLPPGIYQLLVTSVDGKMKRATVEVR